MNETIKQGKVPETLFKYRSWDDNTKKILQNLEIYLPSISKLNDPFEGSIPYIYDHEELTEENIYEAMTITGKRIFPSYNPSQLHMAVLDQMSEKSLFNENYLKERSEDSIKHIDKTFGIFSLTTEKNNYLMWSHYANSHQGICIGFNSDKIGNDIEGLLLKVTYQKKLPLNTIFGEDTIIFAKRMLGTKSDVWTYENEYRITKYNGANKSFQISHDSITEIILGCKISPSDKAEIINIVSANLKDCSIYETVLSRTKFELELRKI